MSPTGRSMKLFRQWGFRVDIVERWIEIDGKKFRKDCFGGFDLLAVDPRERQTWLVQCTSAANLSSRVKKVRSLPVVADLLRAGLKIECWGWEKLEADGVWRVRRVDILADGLEPVDVAPRRRRKRHRQPGLFD
jgi:hypothetical protein